MTDRLRLVLIEWEDSHALSSGWMHLDGEYATEPRVIFSVGWLIVDNERIKIIVPHRNEETPHAHAQGAGVISIPTLCVVRIANLSEMPMDADCGRSGDPANPQEDDHA